MKQLFDTTSIQCSKLVTKAYSTSFSLGIGLLDKKFRNDIYAIYGFVRYADEIVDSFHNYDKAVLLKRFVDDTWNAIREGISLNPILNSFQYTVNKYQVPHDLITSFLHSMEMDLDQSKHDLSSYKEYIYGSAEVVGLMCLKVFVEGSDEKYLHLRDNAISLGAAFQKVNFLRDLRHDSMNLGRTYFPEIQLRQFDEETKKLIEEDIQKDFDHAYEGIIQLPGGSRLGVYVAYKYYLSLFHKIQKTPSHSIMQTRIRIPDFQKLMILGRLYCKHSLNLL